MDCFIGELHFHQLQQSIGEPKLSLYKLLYIWYKSGCISDSCSFTEG